MTIALVIVAVLAVFMIFDFARFMRKRMADKATEASCHSGGNLIIDSSKTYYVMPNGERRKLADYPMDLDPKSKDMRMFAAIMEQAHKEHEIAKIRQMQGVAGEIVSYEETANISNDEYRQIEKSAKFGKRYGKRSTVGDMQEVAKEVTA